MPIRGQAPDAVVLRGRTAGGEAQAARLTAAEAVLERAQVHVAAAPGDPLAALPAALVAYLLCRAPEAGVPLPLA